MKLKYKHRIRCVISPSKERKVVYGVVTDPDSRVPGPSSWVELPGFKSHLYHLLRSMTHV